MKKHQFILASTIAFIVLFYNQWLGYNLGLYGLFLLGLLVYQHATTFLKDKVALILGLCSLCSCFSFAYYGDFFSFLALFSSFVLLQFRLEKPNLTIILAFPLAILNAVASSIRVFFFQSYVPQQNIKENWLKKTIAFLIIPMVFLSLFVWVYANGSTLITDLFMGYELDINFYQLLFVSVFGFYFSFSYWNFWIPDAVYHFQNRLEDDFNAASNGNNSFLGIDFERKSGEISLFLLNALILIFIASYTYEQFFQTTISGNLSAEIHERINSVIVSMIMAIAVVLIFFRTIDSFQKEGNRLRILAQTWIVLNMCLLFTAFLKNTEYVSEFGFTYKRLGVFAFLILVFFGLWYSFQKIKNKKTNAYLFKRIFWYGFATILVCSFVNWGNLITKYNIAVGKGVEPEYLANLHFNHTLREAYFEENNIENVWVDYQIKDNEKAPFLSKILYYQFLAE
ncbi:DUF4153 domain-containing protein [Flavobacterium agrisoli]|uniref:DUF4173 domain-containing protein n=1 Tax=Flavobacterium agrisoli TaxID=2793066 RepID=A0A934PNJ0_9FLAO|nr:DUF4173 domain-containing protein [Flavobacterium agrisoli]MBK0370807.1 DUF4173 domain-containing protein [Flavobacterium agrisoli]